MSAESILDDVREVIAERDALRGKAARLERERDELKAKLARFERPPAVAADGSPEARAAAAVAARLPVTPSRIRAEVVGTEDGGEVDVVAVTAQVLLRVPRLGDLPPEAVFG